MCRTGCQLPRLGKKSHVDRLDLLLEFKESSLVALPEVLHRVRVKPSGSSVVGFPVTLDVWESLLVDLGDGSDGIDGVGPYPLADVVTVLVGLGTIHGTWPVGSLRLPR